MGFEGSVMQQVAMIQKSWYAVFDGFFCFWQHGKHKISDLVQSFQGNAIKLGKVIFHSILHGCLIS